MVVDLVVPPKRSDVRKSPTAAVIIPLPLITMGVEVSLHSLFLIRRPWEVVGEAAAGQFRRNLWRVALRCAYGSDVWAAGRERRQEPHRLGSVVGLAGLAGTGVTRSGQDGDAARAELAEEVAYLLGVGARHNLLVYAVGEGEHGGELRVWEGD